MLVNKCENGHFFDSDRYQVCPFCFAPAQKTSTESDKEQIAVDNSLPTGTVLRKRYVLMNVVGRGAIGIIYRAYDTRLEIIVGIKEFFPSSLMSRTRDGVVITNHERKDELAYRKDRFLAEARTLAKLRNNYIIPNLFDCFIENDTVYMIMELLEGEDLTEYLKKCGGTVDIDFAINVASAVGNALVAMHSLGLIHRDVAPDNIFISNYGEHRIKLLDVCLAHSSEPDDNVIDIVLKPGFSPPEQYDHPDKLTPACDIYALGATLYKLLTGVTPVESTNRMFCDTVIPPYQINTSIPRELSNAIMKAMELKTRHRFKTVEDFLVVLRDVEKNKDRSSNIEAAKPTLFLSYCSKDEHIADLIESTLNDESNFGIKISRYTRLPYRESFKKFMNSIQDHDYVFCIVSDNYLKSQACMYEVGEIVKDHKYKDKLFFVVLNENDRRFYPDNYYGKVAANIYGGAVNRLEYTTFWKDKYDELANSIQTMNDIEASTNASDELKEIGRIYRNDINEFLAYLADYNGKNFEALLSNRFRDVIKLMSFSNLDS